MKHTLESICLLMYGMENLKSHNLSPKTLNLSTEKNHSDTFDCTDGKINLTSIAIAVIALNTQLSHFHLFNNKINFATKKNCYSLFFGIVEKES